MRILCKPIWKQDDVKKVLEELQSEIGTIKYVVSDNGSEIKSGLELGKIKQVYDLTHALAGITKRIFENDEQYNDITKEMSAMRVKFAQTDVAQLIPLTQRKKSHYQNIKRISDYLSNFLRYVDEERFKQEGLEHREEQLKWIQAHKVFINNFFELNEVISKIEEILKKNGLSKSTVKECNILVDNSNNPYIKKLEVKLKEYFTKIQTTFPGETVLCTSDVIESAFGKYKNYVSENPMAGITNLILCLAAFTSNLTKESVKDALETIKVNDIKDWTEKNIGNTLHQKRKLSFASTENWRKFFELSTT